MSIKQYIQLYRHRHRNRYPQDSVFFITQKSNFPPLLSIYGRKASFEQFLESIQKDTKIVSAGIINPEKFEFTSEIETSTVFMCASRLAFEIDHYIEFKIEDFIDADVQRLGIPMGYRVRDLTRQGPNGNGSDKTVIH